VLEGPNITHAYLAPGNYSVTVTCHDDSGGNATNNSEVEILNLDPRAAVRAEHGSHPLEVLLTAQAKDDDGAIASYNWSFGDGTFGSGPAVSHRYSLEGDYEIGLTVTDDMGAVGEANILVEVRPANIFLAETELVQSNDGEWKLYAYIANQGPVPVQVTLSIEARGYSLLKEYNVSGNSSTQVILALEGFKGGNITFEVITPEGWETYHQDNKWSAFVEREEPFPYWMVGVGILVIAAIGAALFFRRR